MQKQLLIKQRKEAEAAALAAKEQQMAEQRNKIGKAKISALKLATAATSKARASTGFFKMHKPNLGSVVDAPSCTMQ